MFYTNDKITGMAKNLFAQERNIKRLDGWFLCQEIAQSVPADLPEETRAAYILRAIAEKLPLSISEDNIFAGTQRDAFARSYALINPAFKASEFSGYCDPTAVFNDIEPNSEFTAGRINALREKVRETPFVKALTKVNDEAGDCASEAVFFVEQVTGHLIPDFRKALEVGVDALIENARNNAAKTPDSKKKAVFEAILVSLSAVKILAERYKEIALNSGRNDIAEILDTVPRKGARNLKEALQFFILLWQVMCLEQAPNPFAFSVGNADRIFEPYGKGLSRADAAAFFKHFLVFFNVGDRSWAISQNILIGGKSLDGSDLTNPTTYAILDAYYDMNLPQPILSVKLHKNTPEKLYRELGKFFFTPGCLTPSLFNDDSVFETLKKSGVKDEDLENYAVAGCQEPLIMGKDNGNTTNSWLNLAKILELALNNGKSLITGKELGLGLKDLSPHIYESFTEAKTENGPLVALLSNIKELFYKQAEYFIGKMTALANDASRAVSHLRTPFLSAFMGGLESGIDLRDPERQGTEYNGSGCLIHGLSVVADSFSAIERFVRERPGDAGRLLNALRENFQNGEDLRQYLLDCPKYGNNIDSVDALAVEIVEKISQTVRNSKNYLGNPFRADWSSPSTHLLYGYHTGATPDGRRAREMLGYGIDPLYGEAQLGMGFRVLSNMKLPFDSMNGGYASHFGIDPNYFTAENYEGKGLDFKRRVIDPLFFNERNEKDAKSAPFYLYVNVTTPEILKKVLENPKKYAPTGVYIMRIHGTFVNFLDLSPEIQTDIVKRLDLRSTALV